MDPTNPASWKWCSLTHTLSSPTCSAKTTCSIDSRSVAPWSSPVPACHSPEKIPSPTCTTTANLAARRLAERAIVRYVQAMTVFEPTVYAERRSTLDERMRQQDVDVLFCPPSGDLEYLTGARRRFPTFGNISYTHGWVCGAFFRP